MDNEVDENDDDDSRVFSTRSLPSAEHEKLAYDPVVSQADLRNVPCWTLAGYQRIVKGHYRSSAVGNSTVSGQSQYVVLFLVVFRLEDKNTDLVVSMNYPVKEQAEVEAIHNPDTNALLSWIDAAPGLKDAEKVLKEIIANLEIVDWSLFDEDEE